jgi:uncharacterized protein YjgD (DUF1641 family)/CRISPR/Cas system CSM-associated protein Csm2 small subunit
MSTLVMDSALAPERPDQLSEIGRKLDLLTQTMMVLSQQVNYLQEQAENSRRRQQEWDDLLADLGPVAKDMYAAAEEQLEEVQQFVQLEDMLALVKRLARNTRNINELLDYLESGLDLVHDAAPLTKDMMTEATVVLSDLERKGYFGFVRQGGYVVDQVVTSFGEEDVKRLGDNVVLILNTVKSLTQPQMMNLVTNLTQGFHAAEAEADAGTLDTSLFGLLRQMRDPDVRRGLAVTLATLRRVSQQSK